MIQSPIEIMIMALRHLGVFHTIADINERSNEAQVCREFYPQAVEETLKEFLWTFASKTLQLTQLAGPNLPQGTRAHPQYQFGYQYPPEALHIRKLFSGSPMIDQSVWAGSMAYGWPWNWQGMGEKLPYKIAPNPTQPGTLWLLCNWEKVWAEITVSAVPENLYGAKLTLALSFRLASYIAPALTAGDPYHLGDGCKVKFEEKIREAKSVNIEEQRDEPAPESEFVRTRSGGSGPMPGAAPWGPAPGGFDVSK